MDMNPNTGFDMDQLRQFADSDAGKAIINLLNKADSAMLQEAVSMASSGELNKAKEIVEKILTAPETKAELSRLGEKNGR